MSDNPKHTHAHKHTHTNKNRSKNVPLFSENTHKKATFEDNLPVEPQLGLYKPSSPQLIILMPAKGNKTNSMF